MYYQGAELPRDNTVCRAMPLCITQQVQTGGKCIQKRGIKSASVRGTPLTQSVLDCTLHRETSSEQQIGC